MTPLKIKLDIHTIGNLAEYLEHCILSLDLNYIRETGDITTILKIEKAMHLEQLFCKIYQKHKYTENN